MTTRRASRRPVKPTPVPQAAQDRKVRNLPMFGPGIVVTIPLHLLPAYLELYNLSPMTRGEVQDLAKRGIHKASDVLFVRRDSKDENHG